MRIGRFPDFSFPGFRFAEGSCQEFTPDPGEFATHNLLTILPCALEATGLREGKVERRAAQSQQEQPLEQQVPAQKMVRHATQLTCQFIRLVRHCLDHRTLWPAALPLFQQRLYAYL